MGDRKKYYDQISNEDYKMLLAEFKGLQKWFDAGELTYENLSNRLSYLQNEKFAFKFKEYIDYEYAAFIERVEILLEELGEDINIFNAIDRYIYDEGIYYENESKILINSFKEQKSEEYSLLLEELSHSDEFCRAFVKGEYIKVLQTILYVSFQEKFREDMYRLQDRISSDENISLEDIKLIGSLNSGELEKPYKDTYMLLSRLKQDLDYYLGAGQRAAKHLWAGDERKQIDTMREIWQCLPAKPLWLTKEDIGRYENEIFNKEAERVR